MITLFDLLDKTWNSQEIEIFEITKEKNNVNVLYNGLNSGERLALCIKEHGMREMIWQYSRGDIIAIKIR